MPTTARSGKPYQKQTSYSADGAAAFTARLPFSPTGVSFRSDPEPQNEGNQGYRAHAAEPERSKPK